MSGTTYGGTAGAAPQAVMSSHAAAAPAEAPGLVADPAPLGLAGFGITTLVLSVINAGFISAAATPAVLALALPYGGLAQFIAGMWAFKRGNTFAATAFTSYGAFWFSYFLLVQYFAPAVAKSDPSAVGPIVGLYLFAWGLLTAYLFVASLAGTTAIKVVFILLTLTFLILAFGTWSGSSGLSKVGGFVGIATAIAALYTSFADVTNANFRRTVLPT